MPRPEVRPTAPEARTGCWCTRSAAGRDRDVEQLAEPGVGADRVHQGALGLRQVLQRDRVPAAPEERLHQAQASGCSRPSSGCCRRDRRRPGSRASPGAARRSGTACSTPPVVLRVQLLAAAGEFAPGRLPHDLFGEERLRGEAEPVEGDGQRREVQVLAAVLELAAVEAGPARPPAQGVSGSRRGRFRVPAGSRRRGHRAARRPSGRPGRPACRGRAASGPGAWGPAAGAAMERAPRPAAARPADRRRG